MTESAKPIEIAGLTIKPGERKTADLVAGQLYTHEPVYMPIHIIHGKKTGPTLFVSAAIHGDELNGIEIIRRLLKALAKKPIRGTLIAIPIVNVLGVVHQSRYLPDRRDLNRSFPGSPKGSLAARLAHLFMKEVVGHATHGIDLHTGAIHRSNLPQIRAAIKSEEVMTLAKAFGAPVVLDAELREGSLRDAADDRGIPMLLYEAGEALRFDEQCIRHGVQGVLNVMRTLEMLPRRKTKTLRPFVAPTSSWVRAGVSGIFRASVKLGDRVDEGSTLGYISDPFGGDEQSVISPFQGIVIGRTNLPLVHEGEALYHIGRASHPDRAAARVDAIRDEAEDNPMFDEVETIT